jgi:predicted transposase/invertase (TIGR01784 family)
MKFLNVLSFTKRVIYNAAKTYSTQLGRGEGYSKLKPVIALTITDFEMFNHPQVIANFIFKEKDNLFDYPDPEIELFFVQLPRFNQTLEELETLTDKWIYFMKNAPSLEMIPETMGAVSEIQQAFTIANEANLSRAELEDLEKREMVIEDQRNLILRGRKEKALEIAEQLLDILDDQTISQKTGLSLEDIQQLRQGSN